MKRLVRKAANKTLYHATSMDSFISIIQAGEIRPQEAQMSDWAKPENIDRYFDGNEEEYNKHLSNYIGYTFWATDQYTAQEYGARAAIKTGLSDLYAILVADLDEDILMPDLNDAPNAKTWQDSAREVGEVCVLGSVSTSQVTDVIIIFRNLHEEINTTFDNWQTDVKEILTRYARKSSFFSIEDCYDLLNKLGIPNNSANL